MASELLTGLGIFKALLDSAKGLKNINDAAVRNAAVVELQEKILAAQEQQAALVERVGELQKEVAGFQAWEREKERYQLTDHGGGTFSYTLKPGMEKGEPPHRICAACYEKGRRAILQFSHRNAFRQELYDCPACEAKFRFGVAQEPPQPAGGGTRGRDRI